MNEEIKKGFNFSIGFFVVPFSILVLWQLYKSIPATDLNDFLTTNEYKTYSQCRDKHSNEQMDLMKGASIEEISKMTNVEYYEDELFKACGKAPTEILKWKWAGYFYNFNDLTVR